MGMETISKKSQQLRLYFAKTAKEMILKSGMEAVSIRSIAKQAGYAYGTIYNHFENLDELLWLTRDLFMADIGDYMEKHTANRAALWKEDVYEMFSVYADYYIQNPSAYRFLYLYPLKKDAKKALSYVETDAYRKKFNETFAWLSEKMGPRNMENAVKTIQYSIHGLLTLCISENDDIGFDTMRSELKRIVHSLLD